MSPSSPSGKMSRATTPTHLHLYSSHHSRSKSHLPQPKVLPFPDLPVRSRPTSPNGTSPGPRRTSAQEGSSSGMVAGEASEGERGFASSISPPGPSRLANAEVPFLGIPGLSRSRSQVQVSTSSPVPSRPGTPARMEGFHPTPLSPPISTSPINRPSSIPVPTSPSIKTVRLPPTKKLSNPPSSPPVTAPITPAPSTEALNDHLYQSFLKGSCADVRLWVRKWAVGWCVHRVVLVQAGFFKSLFLGGFSEMTIGARRTSSTKDEEKALQPFGDEGWDGEDVELQFDDPNITRAAFEICLSRLYSPFPHLHFPVLLLPTPSHPLTPSYAASSSTSTPSLRSTHISMSNNTQLATPRLLLSLLATTIYLDHTPFMREVLAMIIRTVSPLTIVRYLRFAIGDGIGEEEWDGQSETGALGLDGVGRLVKARKDSGASDRSMEDEGDKVGGHITRARSDASTTTLRGTSRLGMTAPSQVEASLNTDEHYYQHENIPHFYGFSSNKLGEACVCYLSRWGTDILALELANPTSAPVFGQRGLPARIVAALLGSDSFWVRGEMERYRAARDILDLRRKAWEEEMDARADIATVISLDDSAEREWDEEELELGKVFAEGIFYTHMSFEDLHVIASDIDPTTSLPYAPLSVLQAAHWAAADLRSRVLSHEKDGRSSPVHEDKNELGLNWSTTEIASARTRRRRSTPRSRVASPTSGSFPSDLSSSSISSVTAPSGSSYHPVSTDDTHRIGAGGLLFTSPSSPLQGLSSMPELGPEDTSYNVDGANRTKFRPPPQGEKTCFGLLTPSPSPTTADSRWSTTQPFRFSAEFWNLDTLLEKERAYSATHFYAGSWFNVYVQSIRKKDKAVQLGIYLQRQNPADPFPSASMPGRRMKDVGREGLPVPVPAMMSRGMSMPAVVTGSSPRDGQGGQAEVELDEPYRDPRRITKAYFSISCASALGTALIRFSSAPDCFAVSQSWGWKSAALRSEEYLASSAEAERLEDGVLGWVGDVNEAREGREGSLRATVVVGVV